MSNTLAALQQITESLKENLPFLLCFIGLLWGIQIINAILKYRLNILGIYPRHLLGLPGIIFSPFLHGSFSHLIFNTLPLFILTNFVMINGKSMFYQVSAIIILIGGLGIWLFGRKGFHVGASTLIMGYLGYTLFNAVLHHSLLTILLAFVCIYYLGGLLLNLFPAEARTSWEGHVFGFIGGILATYLIG